MPIISKGGRKSWKVRLIYTVIYSILIIGTITMVYPFLLMLSSSTTSPFDFDDLSVIPKYLKNDDALMKKYLYDKYGGRNFRQLASIYKREKEWTTWTALREEKNFMKNNFPLIAARFSTTPLQCRQIINDWNEFKKTLKTSNITPFFSGNYHKYRNFLKAKYQKKCKPKTAEQSQPATLTKTALKELNHSWERAFNSFSEIIPLKCFLFQQKWFAPVRMDFNDLLAYHRQLPGAKIRVIPTNLLWNMYLEKRFVNPHKLAKKTKIKVKQFSDVRIPERSDKILYPIWCDFIKKKYPMRLITIRGNYTKKWRKTLQNEFKSFTDFNKQTGENIKSFKQLKFSSSPPKHPIIRMYWLNFVLKNVALEDWNLNRPVTRYQNFLRKKYSNITMLNKTYASAYTIFNQIDLPLKFADYSEFTINKSSIRWDFFTVNYRKVLDYLFTKGRAVLVTFLLVSLTIAGALTVNPLAAYALSRGKQSTSSKFLIFFLATMAFPAEVAMIPGFLLLRDLGLLNTLGALVLPGLANGYSIFLLKGFFDSVPRELYEAADIDGANEFTKFWRITYPMSKPILAVIALGAFGTAYGGFMWAFLVCQNPKMWTIMVWLYDFQGRYSTEPGMCMAAFTLASIPTLMVFLFCQKIIMRGIVIPTMK